MPNPGTFRGLRKDFLVGEKPEYAAAVASGSAKDVLANIQRRFFKRFPLELSLDEEPTPEHLAAVNGEEPDPDLELPNENEMTPEKYAEAVEGLKERQKLIVYRKAQIKRWLVYQYMKDHDLDPKDVSADNPYRILLHQLTSKGLTRPRLKKGPNLWRKTQTSEIEDETRRRAHQQGVSTKRLAGVQEQVTKELFAALEKSERDEWADRAKEDHEEAIKKWEAAVTGPLSTAPKDRQLCILGLTQFIQPILDMVCEVTGWKATLVAGGPEPAYGGRLSMLSVHSGTMSGDVKMNFGRCEQARYKKQFVPIYGDFVCKCYTPEDCRSCALNTDKEPFDCIVNSENLQEVNIDQIPLAGERRTPPTSGLIPSVVQDHAVVSAPKNMPANGTKNPSILHPAPASRVPSPVPSPPLSRQPSPPASPTPTAGDIQARLEVQPSTLANVPAGSAPVPMEKQPTPPASRRLEVAASEHIPTMMAPAFESSGNTHHPADLTLNSSSVQPPTNITPISTSAGPTPLVVDTTLPMLGLQPPASSLQIESAIPAKTADPQLTAGDTTRAPKNHSLPLAKGQKRKRADTVAVVIDTNASEDCHRSKRNRNSGGSLKATSPTPSTESTAPTLSTREWFEKAKGQFRSEGLGDAWLRLLEEWEAFQETKNAFDDKRGLSAKRRPESVTLWVGRARSPIWRPSKVDVKADEKNFKVWWASLQPGWRVVKGKAVTKSLDGDWSALQLPGVNGVQSIIAALFFWGLSASPNARTRKAWTAAVDECTKVFKQLRLQAGSST